MTESSLSRATQSAIGWSTLTLVGARGITFLSFVVLARLLPPRDFGIVAAIVVFLSVIELLSDLGMKATVVYEQERGLTERVQTAFTVNLLLAVVLALAGIAGAPLVAAAFGMAEHSGLFRLGATSLLFIGLGNVHDSVLMRELEFRRRAIPSLARASVRAAVGIALALAGLGAEALVIGMLIGSAVWTTIQWAMTPLRPRLRLDRAVLRSMVGYSTGAAFVEIVSVVATRLDAVVVARALGDRALGLYTLAFRIPELVIEAVAWNVSDVAFPALSRKREQDRANLGRATLKILRFQALYAVPVAVGLALLAPDLIVVAFSSQWREAGGVMSAIAIMAGISAAVFPLGDVFKALARQRLYVSLQILQLPLYVTVIVLAASHGIVAVAWARTAVTAIHASLVVIAVQRVLGLGGRELAAAARPAAAAGLGVALGAGSARLAWEGATLRPLLVGAVAGAAAGVLALRLLARPAYVEIRWRLATLFGLAARTAGERT